MINARDVFLKMKICELNNIIKIFELKLGCRKKENIVDIIYEYMKSNMNHILLEFIIYDELDLLREICNNNFEIIYEDSIISEHAESLARIGLVYINREKRSISIPKEFQMHIVSGLDDNCVKEFSKCRSDVINMTKQLLEVYGVFHLELLGEYIMKKIGVGYRIHRAIQVIRQYNLRNNLFYEDEDCFFYNLKISDRESMKVKTANINLNYKYYTNLEITEILNRECSYEKDIRIILNRIYKKLEISDEIISDIRFMIIEGKSLDEIGQFLKERVKRLSDFGFKSILMSVENMRNNHIIWGYKGYYLEEIDEELIMI